MIAGVEAGEPVVIMMIALALFAIVSASVSVRSHVASAAQRDRGFRPAA